MKPEDLITYCGLFCGTCARSPIVQVIFCKSDQGFPCVMFLLSA